jgi:EAL domain-containing protein (putative c-di-GMP-specific phosphodiesterase class I)
VAKRLVACVRKSDTVARLGGDELVVILTGMRESRVPAAVAARILVAFVRPIQVDGHEIYTAPSIGIALYPFDGSDVDSLLANADAAMYQAKASGGNCYKFFSEDMNTEARERLELESGLHRALEGDEYRLHYQPQFTLADGALSGVEALLRWQPRQESLVNASRFLPLLEESGLICSVGEWVLRTACLRAGSWRDAGLLPVRLAVNVSARQLRMPGLVRQVARILDETGFDPGALEMELIEGNLMQNLQETIETLRGLRALGVHLVMDDFGQGFSSLNCLKHLPVEKVKIDKSFIQQIGLSGEDEAIIRAIIGMGHSLGLKVVAEGVETEGQVDFLRAYDCDEVQGYLYGRPQPPDELAAMLKQAASETHAF